VEQDSGYNLEGTNLRPASALKEEEARDEDGDGDGGGIHHTHVREGSKGSGEKSTPGMVGGDMAPVAIDEHPLLLFDKFSWLDPVLRVTLGFVPRNRWQEIRVRREFDQSCQ
jgi:hypothetical protein